MKKGINTDAVFGYDSPEKPIDDVIKGIEYCKSLGFESLDFSLSMRDWENRSHALREAMDQKGYTIHQTHAPFRRNNGGFKGDEETYKKCLENSIEYTAILGAKYCVVHAEEYYPTIEDPFDAKKAHDILYDLYAPFVELAKARGVGIAFESLFEDRAIYGEPRTRYSSKVEEIISLIESYNDECVSCCWDFGHSQLSYGDGHFEAFKQAFKYISCTHVHDNWAGMDLHTLPTFGNVDWSSFMRYMRENSYKGNLSLEIGRGKNMPKEIKHEYLLLASKICDYLMSI